METQTLSDPILYSCRNRNIRPSDIAFLKSFIEEHGGEGRSAISRRLCEAWDWRQPSGRLKDRACRDLLQRLEAKGFITLPMRKTKHTRYNAKKNLKNHPLPVIPRLITSGDLSRVALYLVTSSEERLAWRILVDRYHYLGDGTIPGEHRLYLAALEDEIIGCISFSAAALHCPLRDAYVGWDFETKRQRLNYVANNQRFLILPWVKLNGLGTKILSLSLKRLSTDWEEAYGHPLALVETFTDASRFLGTVYRAANWMFMGTTSGGRARKGHTYETQYAPKDVFLYPLQKHFREMLLGTAH